MRSANLVSLIALAAIVACNALTGADDLGSSDPNVDAPDRDRGSSGSNTSGGSSGIIGLDIR